MNKSIVKTEKTIDKSRKTIDKLEKSIDKLEKTIDKTEKSIDILEKTIDFLGKLIEKSQKSGGFLSFSTDFWEILIDFALRWLMMFTNSQFYNSGKKWNLTNEYGLSLV